MRMRPVFGAFYAAGVFFSVLARLPAAPALPTVVQVQWQPFAALVKGLIEAMDQSGGLLSSNTKEQLEAALRMADTAAAKVRIQELLDPYCLFGLQINPEMRLTLSQGPARPALAEQGWRAFLVKVANESGTTATLQAFSPQARSLFASKSVQTPSDEHFERRNGGGDDIEVADRWLDLAAYDRAPLTPRLTGLDLEYRIIQLYSREAGQKKARISFQVGPGSHDSAATNALDLVFDCVPAHDVTLRVRDENDQPTTAAFVIRDTQGRTYPPSSKRLAPDLAFQPQVYRGDGEVLKLAAGIYRVEFSRGPESISQIRKLEVGEAARTETFQVERWIDPSRFGWWSGDPHLHAAGCAHYVAPTAGVSPQDLLRHMQGEDLKVGAILIWEASLDSQKPFFSGSVDKASQYPYLLRSDLEVAGFGSHESGHLILLCLRELIYPGGDSTDHWPRLGLNTLRWAKKQGAVTGAAHSGWGLEAKTKELPNFVVPPFDSIGANEYIVDVTHELPGPDGQPQPAVDFLSTVDTPPVWELNIWYHTLNVGFRTRISGESDFPCISRDRVGRGRSYVKLEGELDYDAWCEGLRQGHSYVSDGKSHLLAFQINDVELGCNGGELRLDGPGTVQVTARVAARLQEKPDPGLQNRPEAEKPYWDLERARLGESREVPLELVVNGGAVARTNIVADGRLQDVHFEVVIARSSWVALRILPSSHTNPIFVLVEGKPVRASKRSAEWCLKCVDQCWSAKEKFVQKSKIEKELEEAKAAYEHARRVYRERSQECVAD